MKLRFGDSQNPHVRSSFTQVTIMSSEFVKQVVTLTNQERIQNGLSPLNFNIQLSAAAQTHSQNMALQDFFSHTGADGSSFGDRIRATGYNYSRGAENIAAGYATPENVVTGWMNSTGHRANILNGDLREIGIGYYFLADDTGSENWNRYWTQVFGTPSGSASIPIPTSDPIFGTASNDNLAGGAGSDVFLGFDGNDSISGGVGDDDLYGNRGNDTLYGNEGRDIVRAGKDNDLVFGGAGDDLHLNGNIGSDTILGGDGDDSLYGGQDGDRLEGEAGNDYLSGDLGTDTLIGGAGNDIYALRGDTYDIVYYNDTEDFIALPDGISFSDLSFVEGFDEFVADGQVETQIINTNTNQMLAVLPGVSASSLNSEDFLV